MTTNKKEKIQSVIWDWNGTLLDDVRASLDAVNATLREFHLPLLDVEDYRRRFVFPVPDFYRDIGIEPEKENWDALSESFHLRFLTSRHLRIMPFAKEILTEFESRGLKQYVLSALEQNILEQQIADGKLTGFFEQIIGSSNFYGSSKERQAEDLNVQSKVLMIGDTLHDAAVAKKMNWKIILIASGHQDRKRLAQAGETVVDTLEEFRDLFLRGNDIF